MIKSMLLQTLTTTGSSQTEIFAIITFDFRWWTSPGKLGAGLALQVLGVPRNRVEKPPWAEAQEQLPLDVSKGSP